MVLLFILGRKAYEYRKLYRAYAAVAFYIIYRYWFFMSKIILIYSYRECIILKEKDKYIIYKWYYCIDLIYMAWLIYIK